MHARFIAVVLIVAGYLGACTKEEVDSDDDTELGGANASTSNSGAKGGSGTSSVATGGANAVGTIDCFTPPLVGWKCESAGICISDVNCRCTCDSEGDCSVACPQLSAQGGSTSIGTTGTTGTLARGGAANAQGGNLQRGGATFVGSGTLLRGGATTFLIGGATFATGGALMPRGGSASRGGNASRGGSNAALTGGSPATGGRVNAAGSPTVTGGKSSTGGLVNAAGAAATGGNVDPGNTAGASGAAPSLINCPANPTLDDPCAGGDGECPNAAGCFCIDGAIKGRNCS